MGFNARLAPYSITRTINCRQTSNVEGTAIHFPVFRFPFAGQLISAYANVRVVIPAATAIDKGVIGSDTTGVNEISLWKFAVAEDVTATYTTGLRCAARTGDTATANGISWVMLSATTGTSGEDSMYTLTNKSAARRKFAAGDVMMLNVGTYGKTDANRAYDIELQADYIIGYEA